MNRIVLVTRLQEQRLLYLTERQDNLDCRYDIGQQKGNLTEKYPRFKFSKKAESKTNISLLTKFSLEPRDIR